MNDVKLANSKKEIITFLKHIIQIESLHSDNFNKYSDLSYNINHIREFLISDKLNDMMDD